MDINFMLFAFFDDKYSYQQEEDQGGQDNTHNCDESHSTGKSFEHQQGP